MTVRHKVSTFSHKNSLRYSFFHKFTTFGVIGWHQMRVSKFLKSSSHCLQVYLNAYPPIYQQCKTLCWKRCFMGFRPWCVNRKFTSIIKRSQIWSWKFLVWFYVDKYEDVVFNVLIDQAYQSYHHSYSIIMFVLPCECWPKHPTLNCRSHERSQPKSGLMAQGNETGKFIR